MVCAANKAFRKFWIRFGLAPARWDVVVKLKGRRTYVLNSWGKAPWRQCSLDTTFFFYCGYIFQNPPAFPHHHARKVRISEVRQVFQWVAWSGNALSERRNPVDQVWKRGIKREIFNCNTRTPTEAVNETASWCTAQWSYVQRWKRNPARLRTRQRDTMSRKCRYIWNSRICRALSQRLFGYDLGGLRDHVKDLSAPSNTFGPC